MVMTMPLVKDGDLSFDSPKPTFPGLEVTAP
jgi:hypothetical protein